MAHILLDENAVAPGTPAASKAIIYPKSDGLWYSKNDAGTETPLKGVPNTLIVAPTVVALSDGATPALDASLGTVFRLAAAGNRTIAVPSNATAGQKIVIQHYASGGARTLALNTGAGGFRFGTDVTALTETASGKTDYIGCIYNDTDSKWDVVAYAKGY